MTATTATTPGTRDRTDYSLGVDDAERARLLAQCAMHRAEAELLLDRVGLRPGYGALDLGCGPLGVLDLLAERVGPAGQVVGIDREERYLVIARQELDARGLGGVTLVAADATGTDLEPASFDLVHERLVLNNVPRPDAVVAEMARLTRPGGQGGRAGRRLDDLDLPARTRRLGPAAPRPPRPSGAGTCTSGVGFPRCSMPRVSSTSR